jgi:hypothetical protein
MPQNKDITKRERITKPYENFMYILPAVPLARREGFTLTPAP